MALEWEQLLGFQSPLKGGGKSTDLGVMYWLCKLGKGLRLSESPFSSSVKGSNSEI